MTCFVPEADFCTMRPTHPQSAVHALHSQARSTRETMHPASWCCPESSTTEIPFDKRVQMCGVGAFFNCVEHLRNPGMSVISPGTRPSKKSSCTTSTVFSRLAKSRARVDFPAAILPQKKISFPRCSCWEVGLQTLVLVQPYLRQSFISSRLPRISRSHRSVVSGHALLYRLR
jgi:hypothetical protein